MLASYHYMKIDSKLAPEDVISYWPPTWSQSTTTCSSVCLYEVNHPETCTEVRTKYCIIAIHMMTDHLLYESNPKPGQIIRDCHKPHCKPVLSWLYHWSFANTQLIQQVQANERMFLKWPPSNIQTMGEQNLSQTTQTSTAMNIDECIMMLPQLLIDCLTANTCNMDTAALLL